MATNVKHFTTDTIDLPVSSGVSSGDPVAVGGITGIALTDRDSDGNATVLTTPAPVVTVSVEAIAGNAITVGEMVYIDTTAETLSNDDFGHPFGRALEAIDAGTTATIDVRLQPGQGISS